MAQKNGQLFFEDLVAHVHSMTATTTMVEMLNNDAIRFYFMGIVTGVAILAILAIFPGTYCS